MNSRKGRLPAPHTAVEIRVVLDCGVKIEYRGTLAQLAAAGCTDDKIRACCGQKNQGKKNRDAIGGRFHWRRCPIPAHPDRMQLIRAYRDENHLQLIETLPGVSALFPDGLIWPNESQLKYSGVCLPGLKKALQARYPLIAVDGAELRTYADGRRLRVAGFSGQHQELMQYGLAPAADPNGRYRAMSDDGTIISGGVYPDQSAYAFHFCPADDRIESFNRRAALSTTTAREFHRMWRRIAVRTSPADSTKAAASAHTGGERTS